MEILSVEKDRKKKLRFISTFDSTTTNETWKYTLTSKVILLSNFYFVIIQKLRSLAIFFLSCESDISQF